MGEITQQRKVSAGLTHVYRPRWWFFYWVLAVGWSLFVLLDIRSLILFVSTNNDWVGATVGLILLGAMTALFCKSAIDTRIVVTDNYLEYYGIGYRVRVRWKDLM